MKFRVEAEFEIVPNANINSIAMLIERILCIGGVKVQGNRLSFVATGVSSDVAMGLAKTAQNIINKRVVDKRVVIVGAPTQ